MDEFSGLSNCRMFNSPIQAKKLFTHQDTIGRFIIPNMNRKHISLPPPYITQSGPPVVYS